MVELLPIEYKEYLESSKVLYVETTLPDADYFDLEPLDSIEKFNTDIQIAEYAPGYVAFASNGGGEIFVFNSSGEIFILPLIGMAKDVAIKVADSWEHFLDYVVSIEQTN
ncbi:SMI1/KNR4 family protein [Pseudoalteromonas sp. SR41-8]|uniref:SMI1/KNR4 family protein n=1 Tax=Pseudoalteromonas sp. SR41-8 TaxID=2760946 RepID=UPI001603EDA1|nr:SMI1/KNR4 family protein [Pseudoalteromonas sp. SR41-8]MBB1308142.1 SMI1/KNR4 family protein [Pseudoalteromonas sp. SR41-8]